MILTGSLLLPFVWWGWLGRWQALALLALLAVFLRAMFRRGGVSEPGAEPRSTNGLVVALLGTVFGLGLLSGGAELTVSAAKELARAFGVSERVIGLTVVAFGTSVPELASCTVAAARKETGLVLGNVVGSNIFNTLVILPTAMMIKPIAVTWAGFGTDVVVMVSFTVLLLLFLIGGRKIHRVEGGALTVLYLGYIAYLAVYGD